MKISLARNELEKIGEIMEFLQENSYIDINKISLLYSSIVELVTNSFEHGYSDNSFLNPSVECHVNLCLEKQLFEISVVDYGITIPQSVLNKISLASISPADYLITTDSDFIDAAIYKGSLFQLPMRGKGLASIVTATTESKYKEFTLKSRSGILTISSQSQQKIENTDSIFNGTSATISVDCKPKIFEKIPNTLITVAKDFSKFPGGRLESEGANSGEAFRKLIHHALTRADVVSIDIDGVLGFADSFLEETFCGLRREGFSRQDLKNRLNFISKDTFTVASIYRYINLEDENGR